MGLEESREYGGAGPLEGTAEDMSHGKEEPAKSQGSNDRGCEQAGLAPTKPWEEN